MEVSACLVDLTGTMKKERSGYTRRDFLKVLGSGLGGGLLLSAGWLRTQKFKPIPMIRESRWMLGTFINISVQHADAARAQDAIQSAFEAVAKVDQVMSIHKPESDLSAVNQASGSEMVLVDPSLLEVLETAQNFHPVSGGLYDVASLPLLQLYGFYADSKSPHHYPSDRTIQNTLDRVGQKFIAIDRKESKVGLTKKGAGIDLGSIGKGYAVDQAGKSLRLKGITQGLIDAGGNVLAIGGPFSVGIYNPQGTLKEPYFETLSLENKAVATSGNYQQSVILDGLRVGHLFDARRGTPAKGGLSTTAVAENAMLADALSTASFVMGPKGELLLKKWTEKIVYHGFS